MDSLIIGTIFQKLLYWFLQPFYFIYSLGSSPKLPSITSPYLHMSVTQIANKIRSGEVKSREVVDACIERIRKVNPIVNAVVQDRFKEAQEEADEVDEYIAANRNKLENIRKEKPLLGVPFTVKESCRLKGMSLSVGCVPLKGQVTPEDGDAVSELRKAGAIPLCVTNTPELCLFWETNNHITGCTRNPYDTHRTSGGSSGGEGALIGSGASLFGIGSDLGGSIRVPAFYNGIFGHKPSPGWVSVEGHYPETKGKEFQQLLGLGPMTRYAEDLTLLMKVLCKNPDYRRSLDEQVDLSKINVYYIEQSSNEWYAVPVDSEIKTKIREAVEHLKTKYGCKTQKGPFEELENYPEVCDEELSKVLAKDDLHSFTLEKYTTKPHDLLEFFKALFGLSNYSLYATTVNLYKRYRSFDENKREMFAKRNDMLKLKFKDVLKDNGVLLYPTFPKLAVRHYETISITYGVMYVFIANILGLPATHVPMGINKNGLPVGFQVIAAPNQDRLCLAVAKALEEQFGGWIPPP